MKEIRRIFNIDKKKKRKEVVSFNIYEVIIITIAFAVVSSLTTGFVVNHFTKVQILDNPNLSDITETYQMIMDEYYEEVDEKGLANAAIDGMFDFLNENYSIHLNNDATTDLEDKLKGYYDGIGIEIGKNTSGVVVTRVFDGTPASEAGIKAGDYLIDVEGTEINASSVLEDVTTLIKGKKEIVVTVKRDKEKKSFIVNIKTIEIPVVSTNIYEKNDSKIGYLYLETFSSNAANQVNNALKSLEKDNVDSLIIDLRGNTGGYLTVTTDIAKLFLKEGSTIYSLETKNEKEVVKDNTKEYRTIPIVVLINNGTASASEILAAALRDSYGAIIVGTKSYGKGKVQQTSKLSDDTLVKYTTAKWFTPNGDSIDGIGLEPSITVEIGSDYYKYLTDEYDNQLQKALDVLASN